MLKSIPTKLEVLGNLLDDNSLKKLKDFADKAKYHFMCEKEFSFNNISSIEQVLFIKSILKSKGYIIVFSNENSLKVSCI